MKLKEISIKILPEDKVFYMDNNKVAEGTIRDVLLTKKRDCQALTINPKGTVNNSVKIFKDSTDVWHTKKELLASL